MTALDTLGTPTAARSDDDDGAIVTRQDDDGGAVVNRVAQSALVTLDLAALVDAPPVAAFDLAPHLYRGLVLRERDFRAALAALDPVDYAGRDVAVFCSTDALVPTWAYLLVAARLAPVAGSVTAGTAADAERARWAAALAAHDWTAYTGRPVVVKGCGTDRVPLDAFVQATRHLQGVAQKVLYGEPCSSVPIWRRPADSPPSGAAPSARPATRPAPRPASLPPRP